MYRLLRVKRHKKVRKKIMGTNQHPRLAVFRSHKHIYAQIIDDSKGVTLVEASDIKMDKQFGPELTAEGLKKSNKAYEVGKKLAQKATKFKIKTVVFDRGGFLYHGRVAELARGAREGGLKF